MAQPMARHPDLWSECKRCRGHGRNADGDGIKWLCDDCRATGFILTDAGKALLPAFRTFLGLRAKFCDRGQ